MATFFFTFALLLANTAGLQNGLALPASLLLSTSLRSLIRKHVHSTDATRTRSNIALPHRPSSIQTWWLLATVLLPVSLKSTSLNCVVLDSRTPRGCGWQSTERASSGKFMWNTTQIRSGVPMPVDYLHSVGLLFGVYSGACVNFVCTIPHDKKSHFQGLLFM